MMPVVMKIIINNYVSFRDRVFKAARLGCRRSRVLIQVESAGDLKIFCIGETGASWSKNCIFVNVEDIINLLV